MFSVMAVSSLLLCYVGRWRQRHRVCVIEQLRAIIELSTTITIMAHKTELTLGSFFARTTKNGAKGEHIKQIQARDHTILIDDDD